MAGSSADQALEVARNYHRAGQRAAAVAIYRQVLAQFPYHADAWHLLGVAALDEGRGDEAREFIRKAIEIASWKAVYHSDLGLAYQSQGRLEEALPCFQRALVLQPDLAVAHYNLGRIQRALGQLDEAIASYQRALDSRPDFAEAWNNLGNALTDRGEWAHAIECFQRVPPLHPASAEARSNLANTYLEMGDWNKAIVSAQSALIMDPGHARAHRNLGTACLRQGMFDYAESCYRQALFSQPNFAEAHWNLGMVLLLRGRYEEGWKEYEWRPRSPAGAAAESIFSRPAWDGAPIEGQTILLHAEQGFGDTLHFLRYVPLVQAQAKAARVILLCHPELKRLLDFTRGWNAEVIARTGGKIPACDQHLPLLSLPLALRRFEPLTMEQPYLRAAAASRRQLESPGEFRVGLVWAGNSKNGQDRQRSIAVEKLLPLFRQPGVGVCSLQLQAPSAQLEKLAEVGVVDLTTAIGDFADTAALLSDLDLVISVDTAVAHLAGAVGRPVWVLLPFVPDWRWGLGSETTPWYPTMRLFRQPVMNDWDGVLERVAGEFRELLIARAAE